MRPLNLILSLAMIGLALACDDPGPAYPIESAAGAESQLGGSGGGGGVVDTPVGGEAGSSEATAGTAGESLAAGAGGG
jgi:hypothetical protein